MAAGDNAGPPLSSLSLPGFLLRIFFFIWPCCICRKVKICFFSIKQKLLQSWFERPGKFQFHCSHWQVEGHLQLDHRHRKPRGPRGKLKPDIVMVDWFGLVLMFALKLLLKPFSTWSLARISMLFASSIARSSPIWTWNYSWCGNQSFAVWIKERENYLPLSQFNILHKL